MISTLVGLVALAGLATALGLAAWPLLRRPSRPYGDDQLGRQLRELADRRAHRVAAAVVDLDAQTAVRSAFLDADARTRFEIGSITKVLTGMLLADAISRGEVSLDTTVGEAIPELAGRPLAGVTLEALCTHSSGLPRIAWSPLVVVRVLAFGLLGLDPYRGTSRGGLIRAAAHQRLRRRGQVAYSNLGAAILGEILARRAGCDFATLLRDRLLVPCGIPGMAVAARARPAPWGGSALGLPRAPWVMGAYAPAGGVVATVDDLARLAAAILHGAAPGPASLLPLGAADADIPQRRHGMLWIVESGPDADTGLVWHDGATGGYSAFLALAPGRRRAVVVLADRCRPAEQQRIALALLRSGGTGRTGEAPVA